MGMGIETVGFSLSNAATATAQAMAALNGQSATIRATANGNAPVTLIGESTYFEDSGDFRVRSPRMHDDVNGIRLAAPAGLVQWAAEEYFLQRLYSQDTLTVEGVFSAAPTVAHISLGYLQIYYDDVPGIAANLRAWTEVQPNIVDYLVIPVSPESSVTAGNWGGGVALNSTVDVFKANTLYALIGYLAPVKFGAFTIQGVDIGNLQFGGPGSNSSIETRAYFPRLSSATGKPCIPVVNSQNKASTLVSISDQVASTTYEMSLIFAQLSA